MVSQTNQVLVDLPSKIQTSSLLQRVELFEHLHRVLKGETSEAAVKEICGALRLTLPRYSTAKARRLPIKLIEDLLVSHSNSRVYLIKVLDVTTTEYGFVNGSRGIAKIALSALTWSTLLAKDCLNSGEVNLNYFKKIVEIQSKLLYAVTIPGRQGLNKCAYKKMCSIWKQNSEWGKKYFEVISQMEPNLTSLVIWGFLFKYLAKNKESNVNNKQTILESFIKQVFGSKNKIPFNVLEHSRSFLKEVKHEEFSQQILPAMQKALLRNPEVILESVGIVIDSVSLDLSQYATELGKSLGVHLCMKEDSCREEAIKAFEYLAKQCSSPEAIVKLIDHLFSILNGSEGKLTIVMQRIGVLSGIGSLSHHSISGANMQQTASDATIDHFIGVLKIEIHEGTVIHALKMLSLWCSKLTNKVPDSLIDWFKKGIVQKSTTPLIRVSYFQCMYHTFQGNTVLQAMELAPILTKALEKVSSQPTQVNIVSEGLVASCLILKLYTTDIESEAKLKGQVASLYDLQKLPFLSEKFLNLASPEVLCYVPLLIEYLILDHYTAIINKTEMAVKAMLFCLLHPSRELRLKASTSTRKVISAIGGCEFAQGLLQELPCYADKLNVQDFIEKADSENMASLNKNTNTLTIRTVVLVECLLSICSGYKIEDTDAKLLGKQSLLPATLPVLSNRIPKLWDKLLAKLGLNIDKFLQEEQESLQNMVLTDEVSPLSTSALNTLIRLSPDQFLPQAIKYVTDIMRQPSLQTITIEEYNIFLTPEGVLYDTSVIESLKEQTINNRNVKRESKLYSHKEQMEEMELKKELEAKKKAKGMTKEPELSKKQLEAKKAQLDKESTIRKKIEALNAQYEKAILVLRGLMEKNGENLVKYTGELVKLLLSLMKSPLCAPTASEIYITLSKCVFELEDHIFGEGLAYVTLRIIDPACDLDENWLNEDLKSAIEKRVDKLPSHYLTGAAFAYVFPLLNLLLTDENTSEEVVKKCLDLISTQVTLKDIDDDSSFNMPIKQMLETLVSVIGNAVGRLEKDASDVLLSVAQSMADGLGQATMSEFKALLNGLQSPSKAVRKASLESLVILVDLLPHPDSEYEDGLIVMRRIFVSKFDPEEENRAIAESLWANARLSLDSSICEDIISDITHPEDVVRVSAADAVSSIIGAYPERLSALLQKLLEVYHQRLVRPLPVMDFFGRVSVESIPDDWEPRLGIAQALNKLAEDLNDKQVTEMISFFVEYGLRDRHPMVQKSMLDASISIVGIHGNKSTGTLLPVFEDFLDKAPDNSDYDAVRQSVVILMGTLARHLDKGDQKIKPIVGKLIETLSKPSQQVQEAVANCLPPLVPAIKEEAPILVKKLLELLLEADNYGERRGAAYGLAGLVKGLGILSLKQLEIMNILTEAIQDKKNYRHREGALFALEMLCIMLGRLFEPYIVHILPHLLLCFGDGNQFVREATDNTAKAVMSKLSAHGVKLVLPSLLQALEEDSWRTKAGSVELLGAMAYCAPKQLSSCLPSIVPKLIEVLSDSHVKVQKAGAQALRQIGSVIRNPEIQAIVPDLLEALQDPSKKTSSCLSILLQTRFVHFIDAPSLALIMPVVQRAFQDRSTGTRKMAAQIIGNMYSLTDQKDLSPYLPTILPGLKQSLIDPVPEVRSVSARALGSLVKGMGESSFEDLLPWLMQTLTSENSPVDRSGAAQGLSEVMGSLGAEKLHKHIPDIIAAAERADIAPHVKDGYIMMFIYLPVVFTKEFTPYIGQIIIPILKALADETEFVRETALKAGQRIVNTYAQSAIQLLLPELEKGLFDVNWRIRYSSIQLLGDLLYRISGVSGKMTTETADEDDNFGTEQSHKAIIHLLGAERRNRVLAGLYMGRSDVALMVRQAALHVWKVVVTNTPRTLREILPTLFSLLLGCLASNSYDKRQVAARTLGDLVRKLGERVLPEIIPILERGLKSDRADQRQGVCIGLSEIMSSTSKEMVLNFVDSLVPTIKMALCDPLPEVRVAAAKTFDSLHLTVGVRALDDIIPPLLQQLSDPEQAEYTLDGLRQVMAIKSKVVLPYLVPQLTTPPVNTKALSLLSTVAGDALTRHLSRILPALLLSLSQAFGTPNEAQELEYCQAVVLSVTDDVGVRTIIDTLLEASKQESLSRRQAAIALLCAFCSHTKADLSSYVSQLLRGLVHLFTETDPILLKLSWETLNAVIKTLDPIDQIQHVADIRQAVRFAVSDLKGQALLPGFCLPKGITPILPVFRDAILNGVPELKEQAAQGLGEVIQLTSAEALKPSVVHITGPLIRILGDRFSWNVKVAILETLALLLEKVGAMLKPFLPQLQTTFLKALSDSHRLVRLRAASALSHLITIHIRCDPLFTELHNSAKNTEDITIKETMLHALRCVVTPAGDKMSESIRRAITATMNGLIGTSDDNCRVAAAGCLGAIMKWLPQEELESLMKENLLDDDASNEWMYRHGKSVALMIALKEAPEKLINDDWTERISKTLISYMTADRLPIALTGVRATGYFLFHILKEKQACPSTLLSTFSKNMNHNSNEVKQVVALTCNFLGKRLPYPLPNQFVRAVVPNLVNGTKEKNTVVKANSEFALVTILGLRTGEETQHTYLAMLDAGARDSLQDVINKVLKKVASQAEMKEEELDDTLMS